MNYPEQLALWMNKNWSLLCILLWLKKPRRSLSMSRDPFYLECYVHHVCSVSDVVWEVTSMDKAILRVATLVSDEHDWLDCPLLHYLMNWLYYLSLSLGCEWCACWARTGNHSVTPDARIIWLMQASSLACRKGSLKRSSLTLIWRLFCLIQIAWSLSSNWSYSKLCPLGVRVSDYPYFS